MAADQPRIFLWAAPRTISTAFFRAMMNKSGVKVLLEPYSRAYYYGPEHVSTRYTDKPVPDAYKDDTYGKIKAECEAEYPGHSCVFVKDMAYYLVNRLDTPDLLPDKYIHTFLIRDPKKSVYSLYKMSMNKELTGWDHFDAGEVGFKELFQLFHLVTDVLGQEAIIIDADDLLKHPEDMLRQYCKKVGIEFEEAMLNWENTPNMKIFDVWTPWFEGVLTSKTFQPSATKPKSPVVMPDLPKHVQKAIDDNMPEYNNMYSLRLKPNTLLG